MPSLRAPDSPLRVPGVQHERGQEMLLALTAGLEQGWQRVLAEESKPEPRVVHDLRRAAVGRKAKGAANSERAAAKAALREVLPHVDWSPNPSPLPSPSAQRVPSPSRRANEDGVIEMDVEGLRVEISQDGPEGGTLSISPREADAPQPDEATLQRVMQAVQDQMQGQISVGPAHFYVEEEDEAEDDFNLRGRGDGGAYTGVTGRDATAAEENAAALLSIRRGCLDERAFTQTALEAAARSIVAENKLAEELAHTRQAIACMYCDMLDAGEPLQQVLRTLERGGSLDTPDCVTVPKEPSPHHSGGADLDAPVWTQLVDSAGNNNAVGEGFGGVDDVSGMLYGDIQEESYIEGHSYGQEYQNTSFDYAEEVDEDNEEEVFGRPEDAPDGVYVYDQAKGAGGTMLAGVLAEAKQMADEIRAKGYESEDDGDAGSYMYDEYEQLQSDDDDGDDDGDGGDIRHEMARAASAYDSLMVNRRRQQEQQPQESPVESVVEAAAAKIAGAGWQQSLWLETAASER